MNPRRRTTLTLLVPLVALSLFAAGCGSSGSDKSDGALGAAEPATSPELTAKPAGTVAKVADLPQGIVYDDKTHLVAVAVHSPHRLLLLDGTTLAVKKSVPLEGKARHLQLEAAGGPVLVPVETANELVQVTLPDARTTVTKVLKHPHDATSDGRGGAVVGDEFSHAYSVVRDGKVVQNVRDVGQPGGVRVEGNILSTVDVNKFTVATYNLRTGKQISRLNAGEGPTHGVPVAKNRLAVADTRGGHLILFSLSPLKQLTSVDLPGSPYGMAGDESSKTVWVTLVAKNKVVGYDVSGDRLKKIAEYDTVRQPDTVAVDKGAKTIWVTGTKDGVVQRITR